MSLESKIKKLKGVPYLLQAHAYQLLPAAPSDAISDATILAVPFPERFSMLIQQVLSLEVPLGQPSRVVHHNRGDLAEDES